MHNIKIHSPDAQIVVFPTITSYHDWHDLIFGFGTPKNTTWELHPHKPRFIAGGLKIHIVVPYYTVDKILIYGLSTPQALSGVIPSGKDNFAVRLYHTPQVHPETGKTFIGWALHSSYYTPMD